ncbi:DUF2971 domain-containing protein [Flavobacterium salmonis]|uniref:DUF2971 domain-containing protein n=1 Tax=Flavobacterium salmonis TaxID=2654844 RepID=A0A6V6YUM2_9FLAO|nr:DUF2971 domain-containing protein [Flavobacterium salmonis]CAD0003237.1 hypothetical protein FLAT13_01571 [Flavobacterium salmonis]
MEVRKITIDEAPDFPEIVYKYRKWDDIFQKTIITEKTVFMAKPTDFEDKKDCKLLKRYDLMTNQDIFNKYVDLSKEANPTWSRQQHRQHAKTMSKNSPMKNRNYIKDRQEQDFLEFDRRFGVLSLTANPSNLKMWNKYSDDGKGFCVGFNPKIMFSFLGGGGKVIYHEKLPDIFYNDDFHTEKEAYKEIVFGWDMPESTIKEIKDTCSNQNLAIEFKKATKQNDEIIIISI